MELNEVNFHNTKDLDIHNGAIHTDTKDGGVRKIGGIKGKVKENFDFGKFQLIELANSVNFHNTNELNIHNGGIKTNTKDGGTRKIGAIQGKVKENFDFGKFNLMELNEVNFHNTKDLD